MGLSGELGYREIADIFNMVETTKKSGVLRLSCPSGSARIFFEWGELIRAESSTATDPVGALLVERGLLSAEELAEALDIQRAEGGGRRLGCILVDEFSVSEEDIQLVLSLQFKTIVSDVIRWPGGVFEFDFELPEGASDRFTLSGSEFLMEVGIEAGLLAKDIDRP